MSCSEGEGDTGEGRCRHPAAYELGYWHDSWVRPLCLDHTAQALHEWGRDVEFVRTPGRPIPRSSECADPHMVDKSIKGES